MVWKEKDLTFGGLEDRVTELQYKPSQVHWQQYLRLLCSESYS